MHKSKILCVIKDHRTLDLVPPALNSAGFDTVVTDSGAGAVTCIFQREYDLIIIESEPSGMNGREVCRRLKQIPDSASTPVLMLGSGQSEAEMLECLADGADDYMKPPISVREMIARIDAHIRRASMSKQRCDVIRTGPLTIDSLAHVVNCNGVELELTCKEFDLLCILARNNGRVLSRDYLLNRIWGYSFNGRTRTVDVHIRNLRTKLKDDADMIRTARGEGYYFKCG